MNNSLAVSLRNIDKVSLAMLQAVQSLAKSQLASSQLESRQTLLRPEESTLTSTLVAKTDNRTVLESAKTGVSFILLCPKLKQNPQSVI
jgi:hypothetical protein